MEKPVEYYFKLAVFFHKAIKIDLFRQNKIIDLKESKI